MRAERSACLTPNSMTVYFAALFLLCLVYVAALLWLSRGLNRTQAPGDLPLIDFKPQDLPSITIIVCARNEEENLQDLLSALARQNYPSSRLEIILVDDRSSDRTHELCQAFAVGHAQARCFRIGDTLPNFAPKKRALEHAIRHARGEIILLTDADGVPGENWARAMAAHFQEGVAMVCGYSPYHPRKTLWQKILALEYFSQAAVAAGSIGAGRPLTCTGSNLAYRREAFFFVGGFSGIAQWISGDDDLLLHKMHEQRAGKIVYAADPAAHVPVRPPASWRDFQAQRTRYASKGRFYHWKVTLALMAVYVLNLLFVLGLLAVFIGRFEILATALICGLLKAAFEFAYLRRAAARLQEKDLLRYFPLAALLHPFYLVYFSTRAQFGKFSWRGEEYLARTVPS